MVWPIPEAKKLLFFPSEFHNKKTERGIKEWLTVGNFANFQANDEVVV